MDVLDAVELLVPVEGRVVPAPRRPVLPRPAGGAAPPRAVARAPPPQASTDAPTRDQIDDRMAPIPPRLRIE